MHNERKRSAELNFAFSLQNLRYLVWVTTKVPDVLFDPRESFNLIPHAKVSQSCFFISCVLIKETKRA